jgi:hypothetical protein
MEFDAGMSLFKELAKAVLQGESAVNDDVRAMLQAGARALKVDMEAGIRGLLGVPDIVALPAAACDMQPALVANTPAEIAPTDVVTLSKIQFGDIVASRSRKVHGTRKRLVNIAATDAPQQLDLFGALLASTASLAP